jgi:hypothetical protein
MLIFDLFAGTGSATAAFSKAGHKVVRFELDKTFEAEESIDILSLTADEAVEKYGKPDFVWASPPCTCFSVASMGVHWKSGGASPVARTDKALKAIELVKHTLDLIDAWSPVNGWLMENPRGMLRKLEVVKGLPRRTVTYCQYGDTRQKPTDLWGVVPGWDPKPACSPGSACHVAAPRGSRTGTQGLKNAKQRSIVPAALGEEILNSIELVQRQSAQLNIPL